MDFFAFDERAVELSHTYGLDATYFECSLVTPSSKVASFSTKAFEQVTGGKLELIYSLLKSGNDIVFIDADIVFKKDPLPLISELMSKSDLAFQIDGPAWIWERDKIMRNCCTGFIAIRSTRKTMKLFDPSNGYGKFNEMDQDFIKRRLREECWKYEDIALFPREYFPNGAFYYQFHKEILDRVTIIHFNHVIGEKKIEKMKEHSCWYL
ncbi:MAG: putative nucleotide-diphospho-sugar transferase [Bacteroidota bacterium]